MSTLDQYRERAAMFLKQGAPLVAYDAVADGLRQFPGDPRLRQLLALSLARTGATQQANRQLRQLVDEGHGDEETVGMLARTYKDLWSKGRDPELRRQHLERALHWYGEAHRRSGGYWSGINAATVALLLGRRNEARALARKVQEICLAVRAEAPGQDDYWLLATLGEAALLMGETPAAQDWYARAVGLGAHSYGDLASTRRNARLILQEQQADPSPIESCFPIPRVAVFAGHLIDRPDRVLPRFPAAFEAPVRRELIATLRRQSIGFGYSSAGNGGDILFLEALHEIGAEQVVVLPYNREQFLQDSVDFVPGTNWVARYRAALERAAQITTASEQRMLTGALSYEYGFLLLDGMAAVRAEELDAELRCVAVWDGQSGDGPGGTATSIDHWRRAGRQIDVIDLNAMHRAAGAPISTGSSTHEDGEPVAPRAGFDARIVGLLFADVAGFSKLTEEQIPPFVQQYLGKVGEVLAASDDRPLLLNTWGDGLYFVFSGVRETGRFALRLSETLHAIDWAQYGLPGTLSLRIAVHAGPAYACTDPVTGRLNYLGAHVALAARIEPITPPGAVYGSGAFAALAKSHQVDDFDCTYVGQTPLAKAFGTLPMYVLHSRTS
ncbi:MAG TPA: TRAFs-binding domain-containing protein [Vicinamibacterales bacterium]|nr:TRAFs-binding domain-containing protein [Vicinamibacterales bacterium]